MLLWHEKKMLFSWNKASFQEPSFNEFYIIFFVIQLYLMHMFLFLMLFPPLQTKGIQKHPTGLHVQGKAVTAMFMVICIN